MTDAPAAVNPLRRRMIDDMTLSATCRRPRNDPTCMP